jgi:predicted acetyltransferase
MEIEIRTKRAGELDGYATALTQAFGWPPVTEARLDRIRATVPMERAIVAVEGGRIVGTAAAFPFRMSVPGGDVPTAGITAVAVVPTHRRQGVLGRMMRHQLDDVHARGEPAAALWASEGSIYGRYGYGLAALDAHLRVDAPWGRFHRDPWWVGRVELIDEERAAAMLPEVYERSRARRPGMMSRTEGWWRHRVLAPSPDQAADEHRFIGVYVEDGGAEGYAIYRTRFAFDHHGNFDGTLTAQELVGATDAAEAALWRHCLDRDLMARVLADHRPLDDPLRRMLADPHRVAATLSGNLWVRLVDVPAALAGRRYASEGAITFRIADPSCPWNGGSVRLEGGPDGARCTTVRRGPDLVLSAAELGAAYLGGATFTSLAAGGRVEELVPGALARADAMFASPRAPWCAQIF